MHNTEPSFFFVCFLWVETTSQSLTGRRYGMSTGSSMTWWLRCSSHQVLLCGPARTTMEMYSLTSLLRVNKREKDLLKKCQPVSHYNHVHPIRTRTVLWQFLVLALQVIIMLQTVDGLNKLLPVFFLRHMVPMKHKGGYLK